MFNFLKNDFLSILVSEVSYLLLSDILGVVDNFVICWMTTGRS